MTEVAGECDKRFETVKKALAELLDGEDVGASAAVFVDGEPVADLWGGPEFAAAGKEGVQVAAAPGDTRTGAETAGIRLSDCNSVAWRRAQIPSGSGYGNARSVAAVQRRLPRSEHRHSCL